MPLRMAATFAALAICAGPAQRLDATEPAAAPIEFGVVPDEQRPEAERSRRPP